MADFLQKLRSSKKATGPACVLAIGTAVPPHCYSQSDYADFYFRACKMENKTELKEKMRAICERSAIRQRFLHHTEDLLNQNPSMCEFKAASLDARKEIAKVEVPKLGVKAAEKAMEEWGHVKSKITHLVFTTSTGGTDTPSADFHFMRLFGLNPSVSRTMVYQQGCFAGATALRLAKDFAENNKGARVLVVSSEIFGIAFHAPDEEQLDSLIVQLLFGDGAGACVVGADPDPNTEKPIYVLASALQKVIPNSWNAVHLQMSESGLMVNLSKEIPRLIGEKMEEVMVEAFEQVGIKEDWNSLFWQIHPGGRAILDEVEKKLDLKKEKLRDSRFILSEYGNLISACVFFVMDEMRKRSIKEGKSTTGEGFEWGAVVGLGPGISVETVVLKSVPIPASLAR